MTDQETLHQIKLTYGDLLKQASQIRRQRECVLAGIMARESRGGMALVPPGPGGTGDGGHGRGLMQIDDRSFPEFCKSEDWKDPLENIYMGARVLLSKRLYILKAFPNLPDDQLEAATIAAYNCGQGNVTKALKAGLPVDTYTAHGNYSSEVLRLAEVYNSLV